MAILKNTNMSVLGCVFMAVWTMGLGEVWPDPSAIRVLASREQSEMIGINAGHVSALMINGQVAKDFANKEQVRSPVSLQLLFVCDCPVLHNNAVSSLYFFSTSPEPAVSASHRSGLNWCLSKLDLINESVQQRSFKNAHAWDKKQTDLPSVNRVHNEPHSKSRFENMFALCLSRFRANGTMPELC